MRVKGVQGIAQALVVQLSSDAAISGHKEPRNYAGLDVS